MSYVKTFLKCVIGIDSVITLHYFGYMQNCEFLGESHDFWEFLYVYKGTVNMTEIACLLSYSSLSGFSRHFRTITGMSPPSYALSVKGIGDPLHPSHTASDL